MAQAYLFCGWAQKQSETGWDLPRLLYSLPGLWLPLWKGVHLPQLLHHLCQAGVGVLASPNHLLHTCVQVPEFLPSGTLLEPMFRENFDHSGFLPLGRPTCCGRKKKIRMDYTGIAWLKCYQLCVGAGRKGRKMPTLLSWENPICKVQIWIQTRVQGYFDQRGEYSLLRDKNKSQAGLAGREPKLSATSFSHLGSTELGCGCLGVKKMHKAAIFGGTEGLVRR